MSDPEHELVTVFTAYDELNAEVVKVALEAEGIRCFIENAHQGALSGVLAAHLQVIATDAERARQIIDEHESLPPEASSTEEE